MNHCACGCGYKLEPVDIQGRPRKFIHGHNIKGMKYDKSIYDNRRGKLSKRWKGGKTINNQGYVFIRKPEHPFADCHGYVREHRLIMEEFLGRILEPEEEIHHINQIKDDNRIENLELITKTEHRRFHAIVNQLGHNKI